MKVVLPKIGAPACAALIALTLAGMNASAAPKYDDPVLTTASTPDIAQKGIEADAYSLTVMAYAWGYPLVRMERTMREYVEVESPRPPTSYRAPLNQMGWATQLATPAARDMPTANNDTLYTSTVLDLDQPYVVSVPDTHDRYYVIDVFNMWQELEHYIGRRTTGTKAGKFVLVPPGWKGTLPKDAKRLDVTTRKVWLWGRIQVKEGEDSKPVIALTQQFSIKPLDGKASARKTLAPLPDIQGNEFGLFTQLAAALKDNPVRTTDKALYGQFARIGLTDKGFDPGKLNEAALRGMRRAMQDAPAVIASSVVGSSEVRNGWNWVKGLDNFGFNYPLRAVVAGPYLGGQGEREAMYPIRYTDSKGQALSGEKKYSVRFPSDPPVNAFWSLTVYNADDKMLVENPINRFKYGSTTQGLVREKDGSFTLTMQRDKPDNTANWVPTPAGNFYLILRLYQPKEALLQGQWPLPQVDPAP
ncbi:DUF1254 domain-containing protein [Variovorax robiniae]|uniref:DUF1254 domain-containing protein n=1 Tax=Variovorax robiniae TaxID=1836199 RepID=A0ABU8XE99_9BURK